MTTPGQALPANLSSGRPYRGINVLLLNLVLHFVIIRPIRDMSAIASDISMGNTDAPEFAGKGQDEISSLAQSFNRMRRSLVNAMRMLET